MVTSSAPDSLAAVASAAQAAGEAGWRRTTSAGSVPAASSSFAGSAGRWVGGGPAIRSWWVMPTIVPATTDTTVGGQVLTVTMTQTTGTPTAAATEHPWRALFALCIGFFMLLVDMTIVTVATPDIMNELEASSNAVLWVTSAYLLTYAVPVLIMGRLGDRFGPKWIYLAGLAVFTA